MLFGKVVGTVVATKKDPKLEGLKFQLVVGIDSKGKPGKNYIVAVDSVGAGQGELILYATGSSARQTDVTNNKPVDAVIMAIVDQWDIDEQVIFKKE